MDRKGVSQRKKQGERERERERRGSRFGVWFRMTSLKFEREIIKGIVQLRKVSHKGFDGNS